MPTKHFIATTPEGHVFKRSTQSRAYTHMVVRIVSFADSSAKSISCVREVWKRNQDFHKEYTDGTSQWIPLPQYLQKRPSHMEESRYSEAVRAHHERVAKDIARSKEWLGKGEEGHVAEMKLLLDKFEAECRYKTADGKAFYHAVGWSSRHDLAVKLLKRTPGLCLILQATEVAKRPK